VLPALQAFKEISMLILIFSLFLAGFFFGIGFVSMAPRKYVLRGDLPAVTYRKKVSRLLFPCPVWNLLSKNGRAIVLASYSSGVAAILVAFLLACA
jgi:hypothetical protein